VNPSHPERRRDDVEVIPDPTPPQLEVASRTFALLSAPVRLHLVALAAEGEYDVGTLSERVGVSIATASQHLTKLRLAGIIHARRDGRRQIYTVDDPHVLTMVQQIFEHIAPDGTLAPDPPMPLAQQVAISEQAQGAD
jgi:DNA-binding transcriptional ArsR family regulator